MSINKATIFLLVKFATCLGLFINGITCTFSSSKTFEFGSTTFSIRDYVCQGNDVIESLQGISEFQCSYICSKNLLCGSFFHHKGDEVCVTCSAYFTETSGLTVYAGMNYYRVSEPSLWNPWGSWTPCTKTCDTGTRTRTRTCHPNTFAPCNNDTQDTEQCNTNECECEVLPVVEGGSFLTPNGKGRGATGNVQCNSASYRVTETTATCLPSTQWSVMTFLCWSLVLDELNSQTKKIVNPSTGKFWHNNGLGDKFVSSRVQVADSFSDFLFERQADGSYTFEDNNSRVCDGYNTADPYLHTKSNCLGDEYTHFYVYTDNSAATLPNYHIYSKAYDRIVRLDEDKMVSTRYDMDDERAIFRIVDP